LRWPHPLTLNIRYFDNILYLPTGNDVWRQDSNQDTVLNNMYCAAHSPCHRSIRTFVFLLAEPMQNLVCKFFMFVFYFFLYIFFSNPRCYEMYRSLQLPTSHANIIQKQHSPRWSRSFPIDLTSELPICLCFAALMRHLYRNSPIPFMINVCTVMTTPSMSAYLFEKRSKVESPVIVCGHRG
jgi:hypothetical protein